MSLTEAFHPLEQPDGLSTPELSYESLRNLHHLGFSTLDELVAPDGIKASSNKGHEGMYFADFGRDTAITESFILDAYLLLQQNGMLTDQDIRLFDRSKQGFKKLDRYQGLCDDPETGQERGKAIHEFRSTGHDHLTVLLQSGKRPWSTDFEGMKNWDGADTTALRVMVKGRMHAAGELEIDELQRALLLGNMNWCLKNMREYGGLPGFDYNPNRKCGGLFNQNWKDSQYSLCQPGEESTTFPKKPVEVSAFTWSALQYGADMLEDTDASFSEQLRFEADNLKRQFNDPNRGFLMQAEREDAYYFAEGIDGNGKHIPHITADPALALWASYNGECIIDREFIPHVVDRVLQPDIFDSRAGIRTYSANSLPVVGEDNYHKGPNTFWPHISGMIARGMDEFGYSKPANEVLRASLGRVNSFGSCIEMFLKDGKGEYMRWKNPVSDQVSSSDQAWTAGVAYYGVAKLIVDKRLEISAESSGVETA